MLKRQLNNANKAVLMQSDCLICFTMKTRQLSSIEQIYGLLRQKLIAMELTTSSSFDNSERIVQLVVQLPEIEIASSLYDNLAATLK
jgi:hypothetical protein